MKQITLIGMPRSGTTWIAKIFDSHPNVLYRHEPDTGNPLFTDTEKYPDPVPDQTTEQAYRNFSETLPALKHTRVAGKQPLFPKEGDFLGALWLRRQFVLFSRVLSRLFGDVPTHEFFLGAQKNNFKLVWKSIESTGRIGALARALPDNRFFLIVRHPGGYVSSVLRGESAGKFSSRYQTAEDPDLMGQVANLLLRLGYQAEQAPITLSALMALTQVERLTWLWLATNQKALQDIAELPNCMVLPYDQMCLAPIPHFQAAFKFAGLAWSLGTERFLQNSTSQQNDAYYSIFKNPQRAASRWKTELDATAQAQIEDILARSPLVEMFKSKKSNL